MGYVDIEILVDERGNIEQRIINHGNGASCSKENDAALLLEFFQKGFGKLGTLGSSGKDWEQIEKEQTENPVELEGYGTSQPEEHKQNGKKLDLGYGV